MGYAVGVDSSHRDGKSIFDIKSLDELIDVRIRTDNHCFGCTAGMAPADKEPQRKSKSLCFSTAVAITF